ncbi:2-oxo-4-hydroxy-4-carboxy-5-ureidoimidazoline decarboxylase [Thermosporothrix hazakensis]|jgi:OHCU decarboxylase|uniref:2-oxo-4-hydroxy-4-carboxy-5-ureidoimidazoline decarboxylase n=2 Tax=Thermosporothrix TaxID=768650 RepID=A0A326UA10_THEHA|nr:2-oxo-4-hydroxy-4-carboxy-5-ureidoimidazoline decarboxylase [Thermosporothrix hazakensis]PZW29324.1 2-oxo-4-hydroxy-4-carboxy-5-ureidoimidazoline decarboxylase [Thermosporothrix hazakensis]BBH86253.1 OHCU decarboxylase [Thermosporothrix sp. COM3]GCE45325.1 OHCU decarboxylase [Thermosporothrix hazakensis]
MTKMTLQEINALDQERFTATLSSLFEGSPWIVREAWKARPFQSKQELHQALCTILEQAPRERQLDLIRAHPDLAGRAAQLGTLSPASTDEQASARLNRLSPEELATFTRLNQAYRERFGFPFLICTRENTKESILASYPERLQHTAEQEMKIALGEIEKICHYRLQDLLQ